MKIIGTAFNPSASRNRARNKHSEPCYPLCLKTSSGDSVCEVVPGYLRKESQNPTEFCRILTAVVRTVRRTARCNVRITHSLQRLGGPLNTGRNVHAWTQRVSPHFPASVLQEMTEPCQHADAQAALKPPGAIKKNFSTGDFRPNF